MAKVVSTIGILDTNYSSISLLDKIAFDYPSEVYSYLNDFNGANLDEWAHKAIMERIKEDTEILLADNPKLIVVLGNEFMEYGREYFLSLPVPVINIVDIMINQANVALAHKNIAFLAKNNVIHANLYQRNLNYSHLYPVETDDIERVVINNKVKTGVSFNVVKIAFETLNRKSVDGLVLTSANASLLTTEYKEYLPKATILNSIEVISQQIGSCLITNDNIRVKGKGRINIIADEHIDKNQIKHLLNSKYYIKLKK